jgi:cytoskeletal protein RodZ
LTDAYIFLGPMSSTPFGEHLRREREMRGVSLEEIAAATRISTRFLQAIENDAWDQLPGGVFNRGFIRQIARYLGLNEDNLVAEYALGTTATAELRAAAARPADIPRNWRPAAAAVVLIAFVIAGGVYACEHYGGWMLARWHARAARVSVSPTGGTVPSVAKAPNTAAVNSTDQSTPPAAAMLALRMEAGKSADVSVIADGKTLFAGNVQAHDVKQFEAHDTFEITSSESSAVQLQLNGQNVPAIGVPGQPGKVTLTRSDLEPVAGGSH